MSAYRCAHQCNEGERSEPDDDHEGEDHHPREDATDHPVAPPVSNISNYHQILFKKHTEKSDLYYQLNAAAPTSFNSHVQH